MLRGPILWPMRQRRRSSRALAEVVGTLMLVVITVAAATSFAFFVSAYEKQVLAEEQHTHDVALEKIRVTGLSFGLAGTASHLSYYNISTRSLEPYSPYPYTQSVSLTLVSGDVNTMVVDGVTLNGVSLLGYIDSLCAYQNGTICPETVSVPPEAIVSLVLYTNLPTPFQSPYELSLFTTLGNDFTTTFLQPVAVIKATILPVGDEAIPQFDGSQSYQPAGGDNASIASYSWSFTPELANATGAFAVSSSSTTVPIVFSPAVSPAYQALVPSSAGGCDDTAGGGATGFLTFAETGLAPGSWWYANVSDSNGFDVPCQGQVEPYLDDQSSQYIANITGLPGGVVDNYTISFPEAYYGYTSATPLNGTNVTLNQTLPTLSFQAINQSVAFHEAGLPAGSVWTVNVEGGPTYESSTQWDNASLPVGSYRYWANVTQTASEPWSYSGPEIEVVQLELVTGSGEYYLVTLTVTNTDGLSGSTTVLYQS